MNIPSLDNSHLVEIAKLDANEPALIQNGSDPGVFSEKGISHRLVQHANISEVNELALIQNGSDPDAFSVSAK